MLVTLTKGNRDSSPSVAARAVFPAPLGPSSKQVSSDVVSLLRTCSPHKAFNARPPHSHALVKCLVHHCESNLGKDPARDCKR